MLKKAKKKISMLLILTMVMVTSMVAILPQKAFAATVPSYSNPYTICDIDTTGLPRTLGAEYGRTVKMSNGNWLVVNTTFAAQASLRVSVSYDNLRSYTVLSTLSEAGRDLDNGQLLQLPNGDILLACRSVIWQQSYRLDVYKSTNLGQSWTKISTIDSNEGAPGALGNPDKGVYEPHMDFLADGRVAIYYANEKHVTGSPAYSQIISEKISSDGGYTWGNEIWVAWDHNNPSLRPGMPVWTRMADGRYIVVFEVMGLGGEIHCKISNDGYTWSEGNGTTIIPNQAGGPFVLKLSDGTLAVTSNMGNLSFSDDNGATWYQNGLSPWPATNNGWSSLYQTGPDEIACIADAGVGGGESSVQVKFGNFVGGPLFSNSSLFMIVNKNSGKVLDLIGGNTANGAVINQWTYDYNGPNQRFYIVPAENGHFKIISGQTGKAASIAGNSNADGAQLHDWDYTGGNAYQMWDFIDAGNGWYKIKNAGSGKVLDVDAFSTADNAKVQQYADNGGQANQLWRLQPWGDYFIKANSGRYLCIQTGVPTNGNAIIQYDLENKPWFKWRFESVGDGWYKVSNLSSLSSCLCCAGNSLADGAPLHIWTYNPSNLGDQKVRIVPQTDGTFKFYFAHSGKTWDVPGGQTGNNIQLNQYADNAYAWQRFSLKLAR